METRLQALIFGLSTIASTSSLGVSFPRHEVILQKEEEKKVEVKEEEKPAEKEPEDREALDGYVEMGLLDDERDSVISECDGLDNPEECKAIMEWSYSNGSCNIYMTSEGSSDYEHWYFLNHEPGLIDELRGNKKDRYPQLCGSKKSLNFHFDKTEGKWKYDGYDRHSWS